MNPNEVIYEAESPDEAALVYAAKAYGVTLMERLATSVHIKWPNQDELIKIKVEVLYTKITAFAHHSLFVIFYETCKVSLCISFRFFS